MDLKTIVCILCERVTKSGTTVHNHQLCASCKSNFYRNYNRMFDFSMEKLRSSPQYLQNKPPNWKRIARVFFEYLNDTASCPRIVELDFFNLCETTNNRTKNCQICRFRKALKILKIFPQRNTTSGFFAKQTHQTASIHQKDIVEWIVSEAMTVLHEKNEKFEVKFEPVDIVKPTQQSPYTQDKFQKESRDETQFQENQVQVRSPPLIFPVHNLKMFDQICQDIKGTLVP